MQNLWENKCTEFFLSIQVLKEKRMKITRKLKANNYSLSFREGSLVATGMGLRNSDFCGWGAGGMAAVPAGMTASV
jgi:hypothetical protein